MDALLKKLNYKAGTIVVLNAPPEFRHTAAGWKDEFPLAEAPGNEPASFLLVFAKDAAEVASIVAPASRQLSPTAIFWVAFPKQSSPRYSSDINRDKLWPMMAAMGFSPNRNVAIDDDWSALRFAPAAQDPGRWA
ncbi:MAG: hypothetical protein CVV53_03725 [Spirochaetae bacterium HGW-Spirochaetae-9]|nr:MAG: hypothetical protein CVV53_03725 [Spirochaetae bacterium HGW-Spirochaetae-9]